MAQTGEAPPAWKEFSIAPAGRLDKPLEKTVEWTFAEAGTKVVYAACCPWLDIEGGFGRVGNDPWTLHANGISIKSLLSRLEGIPQVRIVAPDWMTRDRYELTAIASEDVRLQLRRREEAAPNVRVELGILVKRELVERMQIKMHREKREVPVYVLKPKDGETPSLGQGASGLRAEGVTSLHAWARDGAFQSVNANDFMVLTWLQNVVKRPVIGEHLPAGLYKFELKWRAGDQASLESALGRIGLDLVEEKRSLEFLMVEYALKPEWR
jgi:uncharacterized protein (TIGR03435 family)